MERMKRKKKEIRLRTFFVRFLRKLVAAVLLAFLLWLFQITVSVGTGLILPADTAEKEALAYLHTIGAHTDIVSSGIPSACSYAIYDTSGALLETDMSDSLRENADLLALSGQDSLSANMLGRTYVKRQTDTRIVVLTYDFRFVFLILAKMTLPLISDYGFSELLEVFLLLFLLLAAFVLVITRQAKYLSRELFHLQEAADEIRNQMLAGLVQRDLNSMITEETAAKNKVSVSDALVRNIIFSQVQFLDDDGQFSRERLNYFLSQSNWSEQQYVDTIRSDLKKQYLVQNPASGFNVPAVLKKYAAAAEAQRKVDEIQSSDILCRLSRQAFFCKNQYESFIRQGVISSSGLSSQHAIMDGFKHLLDFYDTHCVSPK